jgi:rRNA processing protein Krr1/Pno1
MCVDEAGRTVAFHDFEAQVERMLLNVEMLLEGSEHSVVYGFLEGQRRNLKFREMGME